MSNSSYIDVRSALTLCGLVLVLPLAAAGWMHWRGRVAAERLLGGERLAAALALAADLDCAIGSPEAAARLATGSPLEPVTRTLRAARAGDTGTALLMDRAGQVLGAWGGDLAARQLLAPEILDLIGSGRSGVVRYFSPQAGRRQLTAVAPLPRLRLVVLLSQAEAEALAPARRVGPAALAGTVALVLAGAGLAGLLARDEGRRQQRLRAERDAAERSAALLRAVTEGTTDLVSVRDASGRFLMINTAGATLLGLKPEEVVGRDLAEVLEPGLAGSLRERDQRVMEAGHALTFEETATLAGSTRTVLSVKAPLRGPGGTVRGVVAIARDITGRKHLEEALMRSEQRLQRILIGAREAFVAMDLAGRVTEWNPEAERTFGWAREEAVGRPLRDLVVPAQQHRAYDRGLRRFVETGRGSLLDRRVQVTVQDRHGHRFPVQLTASAVQVGEACEFFAFLHDVRGRRRPEALS